MMYMYWALHVLDNVELTSIEVGRSIRVELLIVEQTRVKDLAFDLLLFRVEMATVR